MQFIKFFNEIKMNDLPLVGRKNASLGKMYQNLTPLGITLRLYQLKIDNGEFKNTNFW